MSRFNGLSFVACACVALLHSGCVSPGTPATPGLYRAGLTTTGSSFDILGRDELSSIPATTAWEAVAQLRPQFLHRHGPDRVEVRASARPTVYLDGVRQGSLESLHTIPAELVKEIRYLTPTRAAAVFGPGHYGTSAIVITSR